jgi:uncharacterized paraquat-inducible protein A
MVKILNKFAIIGAIIAFIPVALPFMVLDATVQATLENVVISIFPWGLVSENGIVVNDLLLLVQFMIPVIGAPLIAFYGSTKTVGGKTIIGVAGFLSMFGDLVWFLLLGQLIGANTVTVEGLGLVDTIGSWSYGFFVAIAGGIILFVSVFLHPKPEQVAYDLEDITAPYKLEEDKVYEEQIREEVKFCPYCGEKIPTVSEFCPKCGTSLKQNEQESKENKE